MMKCDLDKIFWDGYFDTPIGMVWAAVCNEKLIALQIGGVEEAFRLVLAGKYNGTINRSIDQVAPVMQQIGAYLHGERKNFEIPIYWDGMSLFQQKTLNAVNAIPYGETRSYGEIAAQIDKPLASRAVGRANATNPIPLVIPCHRVIGSDGNLRGYGSGDGIKTKAWLLDLEQGWTA